MLRDYLNESTGQQYEYKTDVREKLDALVREGHDILDNRMFYTKQFNNFTKTMLESAVRKNFGVLDFQFETVNLVTQNIANQANDVMGKIWDYSHSLELPSEKAAYQNWVRDLNADYIPEKKSPEIEKVDEVNIFGSDSKFLGQQPKPPVTRRSADDPATNAARQKLERRFASLVRALQALPAGADTSHIDRDLDALERDLNALSRGR